MANPSRSASPRPPAPPAPDAHTAWQAAVLDELRAIRVLLERRQPAEPDEAAARLLVAIWDAVADRVFVSKELVEHATLPQSVHLREAIIGAVGALNAKRMGKLLKRVEGRPLGAHTVVRTAEERDGAIWQVRCDARVCGSETRKPTPNRTVVRKS